MVRDSLKFILLPVWLVLFLPRQASLAQQPDSRLKSLRWEAHWVACSGAPQREFGVYHFRKTVSLDSIPRRYVIHASGDNRYELYVNGARVLAGPARGDLFHWRYETLDIAPHLHAGGNVLAAVVWNFAGLAPMAQMTNETGFILQGDTSDESAANTNDSWKCAPDAAVSMIPLDRNEVPFYSVVGPGEQWDASRYPWGWESNEFDDSAWKPAIKLVEGAARGSQDSHARWMLVPRNIPLMEEKKERLRRVVRTSGVQAPVEFLEGRAPLTLTAKSRATFLLDQTYLTTGYPELVVSGGRGSTISLTYAEALWKREQKGNRDETEDKEIRGYHDRFLPDGGAHRLFRPLWWRTYRFVQIDVATRDESVTLEDFHGLFTAYPFTERARFETDDPELAKIWQVGWRTARLCAHETYMDCPYYEQLQYAGDTRIQDLVSLTMTGDDRLVKNAIELLNDSRTPEGLTQSRYPSFLPQYIPPFSLLWIGMMRDLWWYRGEREFLRQFLPGERDVLGWFESRLAPSGLLGRLEWWNFADWNKDFEDGVPPQEADGQSSILSLQFAAALGEAADLESSFGSAERAQHFRALAARIVDSVHRTCWDASRHLIADTPARKHFSQHANILAVLTDAIPPAERKTVMQTVLSDASLTQCSYYFRLYLFRAMKKAGMSDEYLAQLAPWREMLSLGLTTWAETPEPTRSDCHAWSAHPNFDLLATVAGIEPASPGFATVDIRPHLGPLHRLAATMPHPQGEITVSYQRQGNGLVADVTLPPKISGSFDWKGKKVPLHEGNQRLTFE